jgi:predicted outer membrane repeat protein
MIFDMKKNSKSNSPIEGTILATSALGGDSTKSAPGWARLLGSASSGIFELLAFHPADTVAKRLMANRTVAINSLNAAEGVIFPVGPDGIRPASMTARWRSLFPGLGFAAGYKVSQRTYKFAGQPFMKDVLNRNFGQDFDRTFGSTSKTMQHACAGSLVGIGEVALLPLDVLKIKAQTNPEVLRGRGMLDIFAKEGTKLYRGTGMTIARNAPGSFALFGGNAAVKDYVFRLKNHGDASFFQNFCASIGGAVASITVASPTDVIKTRIQRQGFDGPALRVHEVVRDLVRTEGPGAFFKGLLPKIVVVGPKLVFSFTVAQTLISTFARAAQH